MNNFKGVSLFVVLFAGSLAGSAVAGQSGDIPVTMPKNYTPYAIKVPTTEVNVTFTDHAYGKKIRFLQKRLNACRSEPRLGGNPGYLGSFYKDGKKWVSWDFVLYSEEGSFSQTWKEIIMGLFGKKYYIFHPSITISNKVEDSGERTVTTYIQLPEKFSFRYYYGVERAIVSYNKNTIKVDCGRYSVLIEPITEKPLTATVESHAPKDPTNQSDRSSNTEYFSTTFTTLSR